MHAKQKLENMAQQVLFLLHHACSFLDFSHEFSLGLIMLFPLGFQWWVCDDFWFDEYVVVLLWLVCSAVCLVHIYYHVKLVICLNSFVATDLILGWRVATGFTTASECKDSDRDRINFIQHLTHCLSIFFYRFFFWFRHSGQSNIMLTFSSLLLLLHFFFLMLKTAFS